jgi:hypothetical protein
MTIYQSNTFGSETNLAVTAILGPQHILEVHHTEKKVIHQVAQFLATEWNPEKSKLHIIQTSTSFETLPSSLANDQIISAAGSVLDGTISSNKITFSDFTFLFDGSSVELDYIALSQSHVAALLLEQSIKSTHKNTESLSVCIWNNSIYISLIRNEQLINCNRFDCADVSEAMYYTMLYIQEYDLDPETIDCQLYGEISEAGTFGSEIKQYIRNVNTNRKGILPQTDIDGILALIFGSK